MDSDKLKKAYNDYIRCKCIFIDELETLIKKETYNFDMSIFINSGEVKIKTYNKLPKILIKKIEEIFNLKFIRYSSYKVNKVINDNLTPVEYGNEYVFEY